MKIKYEKELLKAFAKAAKEEKLLKSFLKDMLTPKEYTEVVVRFEIISRLLEGEAQRSIAEDLGVGIGTITRGSHEISRGVTAFKKVTGR
jgi:TrpR family trp operon transcriptional repressor